MDNAIYQFMDCDGTKDGPPQQYPDISQIADFSPAEVPQHEGPEPRVKKFYPGVLDSKYMQAVVRGGREGLLQFRENVRPGYPVPYPWPLWFDHETGSPAGKKRSTHNGQHGRSGYPKGCTSQRPAGVPGCSDAGQNRVPSMYDPPQQAAAVTAAAQQQQPCPPQQLVPPPCPPQPCPPQPCPPQQLVPPPCPPQPCPPPQQPPPFVRAANNELCLPCSAAPEVYADPTDPHADCTQDRAPPKPGRPPHHEAPRHPAPHSTDKNFIPSYLHEPENMAKIIAHDYQRQWVDERDTWETSHATSNDQQHMRMLNRCSRGESK